MSNSRWKLFLDDDAYGARNPKITVEVPEWRKNAKLPENPPETAELGAWVIATSVDEAMNAIEERGFPTFVSFDHDLGDGQDGIALAHALIDLDIDTMGMPADFAFEVHSANPIGRQNITCLLSNYLEFKGRRGEPTRLFDL